MVVEDNINFMSDVEKEMDHNNKDSSTGMKEIIQREEKYQKMEANSSC